MKSRPYIVRLSCQMHDVIQSVSNCSALSGSTRICFSINHPSRFNTRIWESIWDDKNNNPSHSLFAYQRWLFPKRLAWNLYPVSWKKKISFLQLSILIQFVSGFWVRHHVSGDTLGSQQSPGDILTWATRNIGSIKNKCLWRDIIGRWIPLWRRSMARFKVKYSHDNWPAAMILGWGTRLHEQTLALQLMPMSAVIGLAKKKYNKKNA